MNTAIRGILEKNFLIKTHKFQGYSIFYLIYTTCLFTFMFSQITGAYWHKTKYANLDARDYTVQSLYMYFKTIQFNKWLIEMYKLYVYQSTKLEVSLGLI